MYKNASTLSVQFDESSQMHMPNDQTIINT